MGSFHALGEVGHELGVLLHRQDFFVTFVQGYDDEPSPSVLPG